MKKVLSVFFAVIFCFSLIGCEEQKKGQFLESGKVLFDQGKYKESELEIKSAIQEDPSISEPYYYRALLNEKKKNYKAMRADLLEAVKLDPESIQTRLKLSKVYLLFNDVDDALTEVEFVLNKNPENLDALATKASVYIRQKKNEQALSVINNILAKEPANIDALSLKVVVLIKKKLPEQAMATLLPAIEKQSDNISLYLLKIQIDSQLQNTDAVVEGYEKIVAFKPNSIQAKFTLAKVYQKANKLEKAEGILKLLVDEKPNLINMKVALLDLIFSDNKERALLQFDVFSEQHKNDFSKIMVLSKWLISKKREGKAKDILNLALGNSNISSKQRFALSLVLARMVVADKKYTEAMGYIDNVLREDADAVEAKLLKAEVQVALGEYDNAIRGLQEILWQNPRMDRALSQLGRINEIQGDMDKAFVNYESALKSNPKNIQALNFIVTKEVSEGHSKYALDILEQARKLLPSQLVILTKLVELNLNEAEWGKANQYISKIKIQKNGILLAEYLKAKVLQKQKKYQEAIDVYRDLLDRAPWLSDALIGMVDCHAALKQQAKMIAYLDGMIRKNPNISFPYILKSKLLRIDEDYGTAISFMRYAINQNEIKNASLYVELGQLYALTGNKNRERIVYIEGMEVSPNDVGLMLYLASNYEHKKEFAKAAALYEKILIINPQHSAAKNNFASLLLDHYGSAEDVAKAVLLVEAFKQARQPYFLDSYGWAKLKSGKLEDALMVLKKVIIIEPNVPVFRYHLAVAHDALGDYYSAKSELREALYIGQKRKEFPEKFEIEELLAKLKTK